jgi:4-diphosphocytidyl-2-C-methyl-D-erythritol kinase
MKNIRTHSHAKLNLRLKVTGRRANGYHELSMLTVPIALRDTIEISIADGEGCELSVSGPMGAGVPSDESNLVVRGCRAFLEANGVSRFIQIHLTKEIPAGAGCGGGSSNVAAVLSVLHREVVGRTSDQIENDQLDTLALSLGADVPYFLRSSPAWITGIGEEIATASVSYLSNLPVLLVLGLPHSSTVQVYRALSMDESFEADPLQGFPESYPDLLEALENDLEDPAIGICPQIGECLSELRERFGRRASMTGSGSALFVLPHRQEREFSAAEQDSARKIAEKYGCSVLSTRILC